MTIDGVHISVPKSIRHFLHMAQESKFLECDQDRAQLFYTQHPRDDSEEAQRFTRKARQLLVKGKEVLDTLGVRFWLSSGTCLGMSLYLFRYVIVPVFTCPGMSLYLSRFVIVPV